MLKLTLILIGISSLLSCGSTPDTVVNCSVQSWHEQGKNTALDGKSVRNFEHYVKHCGERLPAEAKAEFIQGFSVGITEYCTYENGNKRGLNNLPITNNCPLEARANFEEGYKNGDFVYRDNQRNIDRMSKRNEQETMQEMREKPVEEVKQ
ncbi:DUF2799 domain-containing protein [Paraglaciecola hydrolytica]|uniref:DUF2799 domain-containing protein n=1 Tax=Paraglaciecola hydrolytica TaxID=1799789 RepID=A0A148KLX5_9ALTE|nr:DUF2799 domain-containing protein [Paraglaciecola hydrolytica]KXI27297.1 hypothetical protein AX660_21455 [Paraglaciecola hydrolytica]